MMNNAKTPIWLRLLFPLIGAIARHVVGACLAGIWLFVLHYQHNFNANPELILEYWDNLATMGQGAFFMGFCLGVIAVFTVD